MLVKYITVAQADTRYASLLPQKIKIFDEEAFSHEEVDIWEDSTVPEKEQALHQATRYIDSFDYQGQQTTEGQQKKFPRLGSTDIPEEVKRATLDIALFYLREKKVHDNVDGERQAYYNEHALTITNRLGETQERIVRSEKAVTPYPILKQHLSRWLKARYTLTALRG